MPDVPLSPTGNNYFTFNWSLAAFASRTEKFMVIEMTIESSGLRLLIIWFGVGEPFVSLCFRL